MCVFFSHLSVVVVLSKYGIKCIMFFPFIFFVLLMLLRIFDLTIFVILCRDIVDYFRYQNAIYFQLTALESSC